MNDDRLSLILASSSPYRRELLERLKIPFDCISPDIDETPLTSETPEHLVERLAVEKAKAAAIEYPQSLIIGSDQVAVLDRDIMTKPHNHERARSQLRRLSGRIVNFLTGICLYNSQKQRYQCVVEPFEVTFLNLSDFQIENYLQKERPYQCAGSFKSEGLGITLIAKLKGDDPNSLIGLPLIQLIGMLRQEGVEPLAIGHE